MIHKILGRLASARSFVFAALALASFAASAFDTPYLTFRSSGSFSLSGTSSRWTGDGGYLEYATSNPADAGSWATWTGTYTAAVQTDGQYYIYLRGKGISSFNQSGSSSSTFSLSATKDVYCEGDIETLRGYDGDVPAMGAKCYMYMFYNWTKLKSAPVLSATTIANNCYDSMFYFAGITNAPALPAETLADYCYKAMFSYCSYMTSVPVLPATTMTAHCYENMFSGCSQLIVPPALPATTLANQCYQNMFQNCTGLKSLPALPATTTASSCYYQMFQGCSGIELNTSGPGVDWSIPSEVGAGASLYNSSMFANTSGSFTGAPVAGTTYKVASALPAGVIYQVAGGGTLTPAFSGALRNWNLSATVKNGTAPYTFEHVGGTLPPGLEVSGSMLSGTPTTPDSYNFTLKVTDNEGHVWNDAPYSLNILQKTIVPVTFVDAMGASVTTNCIELNTGIINWDEEWYVATGTLNFGTGGITVSGDANLVLANGAALTVVGASKKAGINVASGNSLTIFGQAEGTGSLTASGNSSDGYSAGGAGIGGNDHESCGTITINGGNVTANGGNNVGAGIGGGYYGNGGTVTINGGTVTAIGGSWYGAGIGGGNNGNGGTVTINGGTVTASAGTSGSGTTGATGIGKGYGSGRTVGTLTVGPAVSVKAGSTANPTEEIGRGGSITIGTQRYFYVETLSMTQIENSLASYTGESKVWDLAETIVGGVPPYTFSGTVPSGLNLNSSGSLSGTVASAGSYPFTLTVADANENKNFIYTLTVTDPDPITAATSLAATVGKKKDFVIADTISGGVPPYSLAFSGTEPTGFSYGAGVLSGTATEANTYNFTITATDSIGTEQVLNYTLVTAESSGFIDDDPEEPESGDSVDCRTADGVVRSRTCNLLTSSSTVWNNSWYYVAPNTTLSIAGVVVSNNVSLVLGDGATLTVQGASNKAGIRVAVEGSVTNSLTIYCQGAGTGKLVAKGGSAGAGIGGDNRGGSTSAGLADCGKVTIYGGVIEATGSGDAAGIGGGDWYGKGGTVAVYGGTVTASAGSNAAGVGRGYGGSTDNGTLTVGERILVKAGNSANPTTVLDHGEGGIITLSSQKYFTFETTGPKPLSQTTDAFAAYVGQAFEQALSATVSGGTPSYTFVQKSGTLPSGLAFNDGVIAGTPTAAATETVVFTVTDSGIGAESQTEDFSYTITVTQPPKSITYIDSRDGETQLMGLEPAQYTPGTATPLPATATAPTGYTFAGWYATVECTGDAVTAVPDSETENKTYYAKWTPIVYTVTYMMDSTTPITDQGLMPTNYTIESTTQTLPATATRAGYGFYGWYDNSSCTGDAILTIPHGSTGNKTFYAQWGVIKTNETYIDGSGTPQNAECATITSSSTALSTGWYIAKDNVAINQKVTVSGAVNLILADGATLTVTSSDYDPAVVVKGDDSLTIYAQENGTGAFSVTATSGPAIGARDASSHFGTLTVYGGNITANGSYSGIGGGYNTPGGAVYVYGGTVIANTSSSSGAGIGGYNAYKTSGTLTVGENIVVKAKANDSSSFVLKERAGDGTITLAGEMHYKIFAPDVANVSYRDTDGTTKSKDCILVSADMVDLTDGWYAVTNSLNLGTLGITVTGSVNLVVTDGASLVVTGANYKAGINVPVGSSLAIYGQTLDNGSVLAVGGNYGSGIGGNRNEACGTVIINGGTITAASVGYGAGIGGGGSGAGGSVTINGGVVSATGGNYGAGIGGGQGDSNNPSVGIGGTVTINGGTITAQGGNNSAGIGGGSYASGGSVTINGGTVTAVGSDGYFPGSGIGRGTSLGSGSVEGTLTVSASMSVMAGADAGSATKQDRNETTGAITVNGQRYFFIERVGPASLVQTANAFAAVIGQAFEQALSATVRGGTPSYTFVKKSGTLPAGLEFNDGVISGTPTAPASETVVFTVTDSGIGEDNLSDDFTYTVTVTYPPKSITYIDSRDGTTELTALEPAQYLPGMATPLPATASAPNGYEFAGWYATEECTGDAVTAVPASETENKTYYAKWTPIVYTVTYMKDSTTPITDQGLMPTNYTIESATLDLPATATNVGKGFYGWYDNSACTGDAISTIPHGSTGNKVFYAKWGVVRSNEGYVDAGGNAMPEQLCTEIASDTTALETGWYVVKGDVTINATVTVSGNVNLILADGAHLTVNATGSYDAAINVSGENSLTIYCQALGTGVLEATGGSISAAIGGGFSSPACGTITINGGTVTATAPSGGAGIGSGYNGGSEGVACGTITINGGTVTATSSGAAGIGGGGGNQVAGAGGTVTINGGTVTATGGTYKPGIGGGSSTVAQGTLTVGANVIVKAGSSSTLTDSDIQNPGGETLIPLTTIYQYYHVEKQGPAPLAQTMNAFAAVVGQAFEQALSATVRGGTPSYTFVKKSGTLPAGLEFNDGVISGTPTAPASETVVFTVTDSGTGAESQNEDFTYTLTVTYPPKSITYIDSRDGETELTGLEPTQYTPGTATPLPATASAPTGYEFAGWYANEECTGDAVTAVPASETENKTYYAKWSPIVYTVTYMTDSTTLITDQGLMPTNYTIESATLDLPATATKAGKGFYGWHDNAACSGDAISTIPHGSTGNKVFYAKWGAVRSNEGYVDANGNAMPEQLCTVIASDTTTLATGWYVAKGEVTITEAVTVSGNVNLILADGAALTVSQSVNSTAGINVSGGNSLTIYAQSHGTSAGRLIATGADQGAGIGGGRKQSAGLVTVYGGNITANGGFAAAGIGGGDEGSGGTLIVYAGDVTAVGRATGIGGGNQGNGATVVVYGGTVTATSGGVLSPGIGGGYGSSDPGRLRVGAHVVVKAGTITPPTTELPHGASDELGYAIELESSRYYVITTKEPDPLTQTTSTLVAFVNEAAAIDLAETVAGGTPDYTFALKTGTIPSGLELVGTTITGTPTVKGPSTLVFTVADSADKNDEFTYTLLVADPPQPITYIDGHDGTTQLTGLTPTNYVEGVGAALPASKVKLGYNLEGWYDNDGLAGDPVTTIGPEATGPQTFYAKWKAVAYRITYKDGSTTMTGLMPTNYTIESGATLPATATKDGYGFYGWYTNSSFLGSVITGLPVGTYGNKTFYAKWGDPKVPADYVDIDGVLKTAEECLEISSTTKTLETGWYVVNTSTTIDSTVTVSGDVKLILADGVTLTVNGTAYKAGINVTGDNSLTIYAQESGTGALTVTGGSDSAGIGGNRQQSCGTVTIVGGNVTARAFGSSLEGAGIGGGSRGDGGTVTIYGGTVVAQTQYASSYGAGIGGGGGTSTAASNGGTVTIYGGNVTATATCKGAGIGGGYYGNGGTVTIYGGTVVATSGESGAGIGGGMSGNGGNVTIEGGFVTATAGSKSDLASNVATGIGKGYGNPATYTKGTLTVGENMVAYADSTENPTVKLGSGSITIGTQRYFVVRAADLSQTKGEFFLNVGEVCNIDLSETVKGGGGNYTFTLKDGSSLPSQLSIVGGNVLTGVVAAASIYNFTLTVTDPMLPTPLYADYTMTVRLPGFIPDDPEEPANGDAVDCRTADGEVRSRTCQQVESSDVAVVWNDSWYYVTNNVTLNAGVTVNGNVSLILCDGATLTVRGATANDPGIKLIRTDSATNTLVIYGLSVGDGAGALTAIGGAHAPGIGTSKENNDSLERFGRLIVNGGVVTASCAEGNGDYGAGIGTSYRQTGDGSLTVNGGSVTAIGGSEAAGIGGGPGGSVYVTRGGYGFDVTVNGGTVVATGGEEGAGIGGGHYGNGGTLTVNGGTVTATGGYYGAGIGGGRGVGSGDGGHGGIVHIYGGTVTAKTLYTGEGSDVPTGIGQGYAGCSHPGDLFVYDRVIVNAGSREDLTQQQLPDENHEIRILASHRYFYIETLEIVPRLVNTEADLGSVDKNDRYFNRSLDTRIHGGWGQLHFAMDDGAVLPAGLELDDSGRLAGTPTVAGNFELRVVVKDSSTPCNELVTTFNLKVNEIYSIIYYETNGVTRVYPSPAIYNYTEGTGLAEMPVPQKNGYDFAGWYTNQDLTADCVTSISASETGNKVFYADWTPTIYSIRYVDPTEIGGQFEDGEEIFGLTPASYTILQGVELPAESVVTTVVSRAGFGFAGWYDNPECSGSAVTAIPDGSTGDKTFYLKWEEVGVPLAVLDGQNELFCDAAIPGNWDLANTLQGGKKPYVFALKDEVGNALPDNLELSEAGVLEGTVPVAGIYTFKVVITDALAEELEVTYTLEALLSKTTGEDGPDATVLMGYPTEISLAADIRGGTAPYTFEFEDGSLPSGMTLNGTKLSGIPTMTGNSYFWLKVTDFEGRESDLFYSIYSRIDSLINTETVNGVDWKYGWASKPKDPISRVSVWNGGASAIPAATAGHVFVPGDLGPRGSMVFTIGAGAFEDCTEITRATIWTNIIAIGENAFKGCTSLEEVMIADVEQIDTNAFSGCTSLEKVYVLEGRSEAISAMMAASGCDVSGIEFVESTLCTLTLDANLGTPLDMSEFVVMKNIRLGGLPVPSRTNYEFNGWYTEKDGGTLVTAETAISGDATFYAHWTTTLPDPVFTIDYKGELTDVTLNGHTEIVIPDTVTSIGDRALDGLRKSANKSLLRVVIPGTVKSIGTRAFAECIRLREINIPEGVTNISLSAFNYCGSLESVEIPGSVETIGNFAFANCSNIVSVTINNGVNSIGQSAFANCTSLSCDDEQGFYIPDSVESIGNGAFHSVAFTKASLPGSLYSDGSPVSAAFSNVNLLKSVDVTYRTDHPTFVIHSGRLTRVYLNGNTEVVVPNSVTEIWSGAFSGLSAMTSVTIPDTVTIIRVGAFSDCTGLTEIDLPDSLLYLESAFRSCTNLKHIVIPDSVAEISEGCFASCDFLESVTIGSGVTRIPFSAFAYCSSLTNVTIRGNLTSIGRVAFSGCSSLPAIELPDTLDVIGNMAFNDCSSLAVVRIPKGVDVGSFAFADCSSLKSANVGGTVVRKLLMSAKGGRRLLAASAEDATKLGSYAFSGCSELENATIGSTVDEIGGGAFGGCSKLKSITVESGNENYETVGGMLLTADGKVLISGAGDATDIVVPSGVTNILEGAFAGFTSITNVTLPNTVQIVGEAAFSNATALATMTIPQSVTTIGVNAFCDTVLATVYVAKGDTARVKALVEGTGYAGTVSYVEPSEEPSLAPSIPGDSAATITGDADSGYTVVPSTTSGTVEVEIPSGLDPAKVTVEVPPTAAVKPNGANVAVVKTVAATTCDITEFLDIPAPNASGVVDLSQATVKEAIVKEVLDPTKEGVDIDLADTDEPSITTAATKPGLVYTLIEGTSLDNMAPGMGDGKVKIGDGTSWTPTISVKGGTSGFYSIQVTK